MHRLAIIFAVLTSLTAPVAATQYAFVAGTPAAMGLWAGRMDCAAFGARLVPQGRGRV
jgi:hypothetical protein